MNKPTRLERLEDVLDAYVASDVDPSGAARRVDSALSQTMSENSQISQSAGA